MCEFTENTPENYSGLQAEREEERQIEHGFREAHRTVKTTI